MAQENVLFHQRNNSKGDTEFRATFGRQKAMVFRRHEGYFYLDLYDNKPGRTGRISIGLDELDSLIALRGNLETLRSCFPMPPPTVWSPTQAISTVTSRKNASPQSILSDRVPFQPIQPIQPGNKRPAVAATDQDLKRQKVDAQSPTYNENIPEEILSDFFYTPFDSQTTYDF